MFQKRNEMLEQFLVDCAEVFVIICKTPVALYEYVNSQSTGVKSFMCTETQHLYDLLKKDSILHKYLEFGLLLTNNAYVPYITEVAMECELSAMINNSKYTSEEMYALTFVKNIFVQSFIKHNADVFYNLCSYQCFPDVRSKINNIMQDILYQTE